VTEVTRARERMKNKTRNGLVAWKALQRN